MRLTRAYRSHRESGAVRAVFLLFAIGCLIQAEPVEPGDGAGRFRYDAKLKKCVNGRGEKGLNPPSKNEPDNECADYRGKVVMYLNGDDGNFRGANFDGAQFRYLNSMRRADLTGAKLTNIVGDMLELDNANLSVADLSKARLKPCQENRVGACLSDARFDARTRLPFGREEALARGMVAIEEK